MMINTNDLYEIIEQCNYLLALMEDKNVDELELSCNTYGHYGVCLSIPSQGYLYIQDQIDKLEGMEDYNYNND